MRTLRSRGFTLIEMLMVVAIITILAALLIVGVQSAMSSAKRAQAATDINGLYNAMKEYEMKYGAFPPSNLLDGTKIKMGTGDTQGIRLLVAKQLYACDMSQVDGSYFADPWGKAYVITTTKPSPDDIKGVSNSDGSTTYYIYSEADGETDPNLWAYAKR